MRETLKGEKQNKRIGTQKIGSPVKGLPNGFGAASMLQCL